MPAKLARTREKMRARFKGVMFTKLISMKTLIIFLIAFNIEFALAKQERSTVDCKPREPAITLLNAINIATDEAAKIEDPEKLFIDVIQLNCKNGKAEWSIGFRRKAYESGHLVINIDMQKRINRQIIKDG